MNEKNPKQSSIMMPKTIGKKGNKMINIAAGVVTAFILGVVMIQIYNNTKGNFTGITGTVASYVIPFFFLGVLIFSLGAVYMGRRR